VILDRDGVINHDSADFVKRADEWLPIPGSIEAIASLSKAGACIAVASNQSGLARGLFDKDALNAMHDKLRKLVADAGGRVDAIHYCPHGPDDGCECRKPAPGLLYEIEASLGLPVAGMPFVGDSVRDLEAGRAAGALPVLVRTGKGRDAEKNLPIELADTVVFDSLAAFASSLVAPEC
jgi:D-glycero-D-manno-heptose 1,7-bisphosphate phosphatase